MYQSPEANRENTDSPSNKLRTQSAMLELANIDALENVLQRRSTVHSFYDIHFREKPSEFKALRGKIPIIYYSSPEYHGRIKRYLFDNANADGFAIAISNYKGVIGFFANISLQKI